MINKIASCQTMREITNLGRGNYPFKNMVFTLVFQLAPSWGERCFMFCYVLGPFRPAKTWCDWKPWEYIDVSENTGTPKSSMFNRVFHYKPSIWMGETHALSFLGALTHASSLHSRDFARLISVASSVPWTRRFPGRFPRELLNHLEV